MSDMFAPPVPLPRTGYLLVVGLVKVDAERWAMEWRVPWNRVAYAASVRSVMGLTPTAIVYLPGWTGEGPGQQLVAALLDALKAKHRDRIAEVRVLYHPAYEKSRGETA